MRGIQRILWAAAMLSASALAQSQPVLAEAMPAGVARVDITPDCPIRLTGYASRKTESEGVAQRLWAKALAIGGDAGEGPAVLMMVENCGVPGSLTAEVAGRLKAKAGVNAERFVVCSTHTHTGPWLTGFRPATCSSRCPPEHVRAHRSDTSDELVGQDGTGRPGGPGGAPAGPTGLGPRHGAVSP